METRASSRGPSGAAVLLVVVVWLLGGAVTAFLAFGATVGQGMNCSGLVADCEPGSAESVGRAVMVVGFLLLVGASVLIIQLDRRDQVSGGRRPVEGGPAEPLSVGALRVRAAAMVDELGPEPRDPAASEVWRRSIDQLLTELVDLSGNRPERLCDAARDTEAFWPDPRVQGLLRSAAGRCGPSTDDENWSREGDSNS